MPSPAPLLPLEVERYAHCLTPDERAAIADALRLADDGAAAAAAASSTTADNTTAAALATWRALTRPGALHPRHPFPLHRALHALAFARWNPATHGPRPVWIPGAEQALATNAAAFMASYHGDGWWLQRRTGHPAKDWPLLQRVSVQSPELFWSALLREIGLRFDVPPVRVLDESGLLGGGGCCCCSGGGGDSSKSGDGCCSTTNGCCPEQQQQQEPALGPDSVRWLPGARLNIAAAALLSPKSPDGGGGAAAAAASDPWSAPCSDGDAYERGGADPRSAAPGPPPALLWAEDGAPEAVRRVSWPALRARAALVARCLEQLGVQPGEAVAIATPMTCDAVAIYLGIILHGAVVVSIADSFAPSEIAARLRISQASLVFTQDVVPRGGGAAGGKPPPPLYARVLEARAPRCVVLPAAAVGKGWVSGSLEAGLVPEGGLRQGDLSWGAFLFGGQADSAARSPFAPRSLPGDAPSNILFSSGTTGEPKAVVWSHITPLRAAVDAWAHQDVRPGDVVCWPTNLGWMMGPWLVFSSLVNGATAALYHGAPGGKDFVAFVGAARVTQLGLVPSIVRSWRASGGLLGPAEEEEGGGAGAAAPHAPPYLPDWSSLRCFSSTGEASSPDDYHWLASRVPGYRPVVEYCGGTEIGGGFLSGTLLQPQAAAAFSTPTLGAALVLLGGGGGGGDEGGGEAEQSMHGCGAPPFVGELTLVPPMLGSSQHLLNRDHFATYYAGMPRCLPPPQPQEDDHGLPLGLTGRLLRRHGDEFARLPGGYYQALGRVDDTMNLGGIKVSSAEIERCVLERLRADGRADVSEAAAVGVPAAGGGPERLVLFLVVVGGGEAGGQDQQQKLEQLCQKAVREGLNPLFRVRRALLVASLPRTASGKVVRRALRDRAAAALAADGGQDGGAGGPRSRM